MKPKKILILDDHPAFRYGLAYLINAQDDLEVGAQAGTIQKALNLLTEDSFDLMISDLTLPDGSGLELLKQVRVLLPRLPILVISMHNELVYAERVLRAGGRGYMMKENSDELVPAIRQILNGGVFVSEAVTRHFLTSLAGDVRGTFSFPISRLSDRELEVFECIGQGASNDEIAKRLKISIRTVDAHRSNIRKKLSFGDSTALLRHAILWMESGKPASA